MRVWLGEGGLCVAYVVLDKRLQDKLINSRDHLDAAACIHSWLDHSISLDDKGQVVEVSGGAHFQAPSVHSESLSVLPSVGRC